MNAAVLAQPNVQSLSLESIYKQGTTQYKQGYYLEAIAKFEDILSNSAEISPKDRALVEEKLARSYHLAGYGDRAVEYWNRVINYYQNSNKQLNNQKINQLRIEKAQSYLILGQPRQAISLLCQPTSKEIQITNKGQLGCSTESALEQVQKGSALEVAALGIYAESLGNLGGEKYYQFAIQIIEELPSDFPSLAPSLYLTLGNIHANLAYLNYQRLVASQESGDSLKSFSDGRSTERFLCRFKKYDNSALTYWQNSLLQKDNGDTLPSSLRSYIQNLETDINKLKILYIQKHLREKIRGSSREDIQDFKNDISNVEECENFDIDNPQESIEKVQLNFKEIKRLMGQDSDVLSSVASQKLIYQLIDLSRLIETLLPYDRSSSKSWCLTEQKNLEESRDYLKLAKNLAHRINDLRSLSFVLGELGHNSECLGRLYKANKSNKKQDAKEICKSAIDCFNEALYFTQKARTYAEQSQNSTDSLYLWDWQVARLYKELAQSTNSKNLYLKYAYAAYEQAIEHISQIRENLIIADRDLQFDLRDAIEPIYKEFIDLSIMTSSDVDKIIETVDLLNLSQIQNFFGNDCSFFLQEPVNLNEIQTSSVAIIHLFSTDLEKNQAASIFQYKNSDGVKFEINRIQHSNLKDIINAFSSSLRDRKSSEYIEYAQLLYRLIIKPVENLLQENPNIETLLFVQSDIFQTIPMEALHDGNRFLIEKYQMAGNPTTNVNVKSSGLSDSPMLIAGLSKSLQIAGEPFQRRLKAVKETIEDILDNQRFSQFTEDSLFLDENFTKQSITEFIFNNEPNILHFATHGEFGAVAEDRYLYTGDGKKININDLERLIRKMRSPPSLLLLTACNTASGDARAALGLSGVGLQSGASTVIGSLWKVNEESTMSLAVDFLDNWLNQKDMGKAEALRQAKLKLLNQDNYKHPYFWSPFILAGDWQ